MRAYAHARSSGANHKSVLYHKGPRNSARYERVCKTCCPCPRPRGTREIEERAPTNADRQTRPDTKRRNKAGSTSHNQRGTRLDDTKRRSVTEPSSHNQRTTRREDRLHIAFARKARQVPTKAKSAASRDRHVAMNAAMNANFLVDQRNGTWSTNAPP